MHRCTNPTYLQKFFRHTRELCPLTVAKKCYTFQPGRGVQTYLFSSIIDLTIDFTPKKSYLQRLLHSGKKRPLKSSSFLRLCVFLSQKNNSIIWRRAFGHLNDKTFVSVIRVLKYLSCWRHLVFFTFWRVRELVEKVQLDNFNLSSFKRIISLFGS